MSLFSDIFLVLANHWQLISGFLLMILLGQLLVGSVLLSIFRDRLTSGEYYSLSAAGWLLPLSLVSLFWFIWGTVQQPGSSTFVLLACLAILAVILFFNVRSNAEPGSRISLWILIVLFVGFIILRFAFISKVILPLYFDSAQHYQWIKNLLLRLTSNHASSGWPVGTYYHMGFHLLAAFTSSTLGTDLIHTMLILGQMIVAVIPLSLFPLIKQETQSNTAALFAVLLAAFGWYMPAYAVNWGKYPALTSLPLTAFVMSLGYLGIHYKNILSPRAFLRLNAMLLSGILISGFMHSRSIVVFAIVALSWFLATGWQKFSVRLRAISFLLVLVGLGLVIAFIRTKDVFGLLFDPYWEKGLFMTGVVLFLTIFAQWQFPRLSFALILVILLFLVSLLIPVQVQGYGNLTLLDRPFVEMILYLPLSCLGGTGLAGLEKSVEQLLLKWPAKRFWPAPYLSVLFLGILLVNTFVHYNFYPVGCCEIVGRDDLVAIDWMDKNLPADARILISSTELRVLPTDSPQGAAGGDAGIWITPLTGRTTIVLPYQSDFSQQAVFDLICQRRAGYLYVGETGATFDNAQIEPYPDRYRVLLSMPAAKVYQVIGCPEASSSTPVAQFGKSLP